MRQIEDFVMMTYCVKESKLLYTLNYDTIEGTQFTPVLFGYRSSSNLPNVTILIKRRHFNALPDDEKLYLIDEAGQHLNMHELDDMTMGTVRKNLKQEGLI
jgi:hypothetical protein